MNVLDLFSNIGGHAIGLSAAGDFRVVQFVEINERRRRLIAHHFPGVPIHDDVRTFAGPMMRRAQRGSIVMEVM